MAACRTQAWRLPRAAVDALKARLAAPVPGASPCARSPAPWLSANDVLCALMAAAGAWLEPGKVAMSGGMNVLVVANMRG